MPLWTDRQPASLKATTPPDLTSLSAKKQSVKT